MLSAERVGDLFVQVMTNVEIFEPNNVANVYITLTSEPTKHAQTCNLNL